jgi:hypothetical protein
VSNLRTFFLSRAQKATIISGNVCRGSYWVSNPGEQPGSPVTLIPSATYHIGPFNDDRSYTLEILCGNATLSFDFNGADISQNASAVVYDPTDSGLSSTTVQDAIDELESNIEGIGATLAPVATSGEYSDLEGTPTLGSMAAENAGDYTKTADLGTMASEDAADYTPTASLAAVALSNDYDDLTGLPDLTKVGSKGMAYALANGTFRS